MERDGSSRRVAAGVILAAGAGTRFGGDKLVADLDGRAVIRHVVDAAVEAGLDLIVVVVPPSGSLDHLDLSPAFRVVNPTPQEGLSSSVRVGLRTLDSDASAMIDRAIILPGDQPRVRAATIRSLIGASEERPSTPFVVARHVDDRSPNPVLVRRSMWRLADELVGDRGFGPILAAHPELVREIAIEGGNPDVDTRADLDRISGANAPRQREDPAGRQEPPLRNEPASQAIRSRPDVS